MMVYVLLDAPYDEEGWVEGVYTSKDKVRPSFKALLKSRWDDEIDGLTDENGRTFDECIENLEYASEDSYLGIQAREIDKGGSLIE